MLTEDIVMGSAGSARPEVTVVEAGSESSEDPDFEPGDLTEQEQEDAELIDENDEAELMSQLFEHLESGEEDSDDEDCSEEFDDDEDGEDHDDDEEEDDLEEEDEEDDDVQERGFAFFGMGGRALAKQLARHPKLSTCKHEPMLHPAAQLLNLSSAAINAKHCLSSDEAKYSSSTGRPHVMNAADMLKRRESHMGCKGGFSQAQCCHMASFHYLPSRATRVIDRMQSRVYIGNFSAEGNVFVAGFQHERRVRLYDVNNNWRLRKDVEARNLRWTITDTCISPDQKFLLYSSISPIVHLVNLGSTSDAVESVANVTDIHEAMFFHADDEEVTRSNFGIWSLRWSPDGKEIIAGTGDSSLYLYDVEQQKTTMRVRAHADDVNAVCYAEDSPNIIVTGSDDSLIKVWDKRTVGSNSRPAGMFVGHTDGMTHLDPKGDGRYLISNCKDQTIKLWDLRNMMEPRQYDPKLIREQELAFRWDYRWEEYPARAHYVRHPQDNSLMTYRGHRVLATLIRAYFSPIHTTAQRFIYAGSADGSVYIYDIVTGEIVRKLEYHREVVRDLHWHPDQPMLVTTSFDGSVVKWDTRDTLSEEDERKAARRHRLPDPGTDQLDSYY
ncbi:TPA: hypothetical protein ACH3X3_001323 [Trebouxia sp. C0006]